MKRKSVIVAMIILGMALILIFDNTHSILLSPLTSPEAFLASMPYWNISFFGLEFVFIQPSSSFFVYLLGGLMIAIGVVFLKNGKKHPSRLYFAIALILWGIGTLLAGSSYQAFGFELKCRDLDYCVFTSKFELLYLLVTAISIEFMVVSTAYVSLKPENRQKLIRYAFFHGIGYFLFLFIGIILPVQFLISYEGFMVFMGGNFVLMFILNILHYKKHKDRLNLQFIRLWLLFLLVNVGYFIYLFSGLSEILYANPGIWFNANDVLHLLLIGWAIGIYRLLNKELSV